MGSTTFEELKEKALSLPLKPGVYLMMDQAGTVIYVGKAKNLKNRVLKLFLLFRHVIFPPLGVYFQ